jgi:hypothetical protein
MSEEAKQPDPPLDPTKPRRTKMRKSLVLTTQIVVGTGAAMVLVGSLTTPTLGSTRSARLIWEARQRQTERELAGDSRRANREEIKTDTDDGTSRIMVPSNDPPRGGT